MITFVPFDDVVACAKALDYRRLGKQRIEAMQIWKALMGKGKILPDGSEGPPYKGWVNHPATLMWKGHVDFLAMYHNAMIDEWAETVGRDSVGLIAKMLPQLELKNHADYFAKIVSSFAVSGLVEMCLRQIGRAHV